MRSLSPHDNRVIRTSTIQQYGGIPEAPGISSVLSLMLTDWFARYPAGTGGLTAVSWLNKQTQLVPRLVHTEET